MSCIRFNTTAQRTAMRDHRPIMEPSSTEAAAAHPTPPVTASKIRRLVLLARDANPKIRESAASSRDLPLELFPILAHDADEGVRCCVARNERTPRTVFDTLLTDPSERVRGFLAINFSAPIELVQRLRQDASGTVRGLAEWKASLAGA